MRVKEMLYGMSSIDTMPDDVLKWLMTGHRNMKKFSRVYAPVNNERFEKSALHDLAKHTVFVCPVPVFEDIKDRTDLFERYISQEMHDFDADNDVVADFGDSLVFAMMIFYLARRHDKIYVARFNRRSSDYIVRLIDGEDPVW